MNAKTKLWYFENIDFLKALDSKEKVKLASLAHEWHAAKNEAVFLPGQAANVVFLLKAGIVKLSKFSADGREVILSIIRPGNIFGELALSGEGNRDTAAFTLEPSFICALPLDRFEEFMKQTPAFNLQVTKLIGLRLRKIESRLASMLFKSAPNRIRDFIRELADEHGRRVGAEVEVKLHLRHEEIAKLTATSRQTVTSVLCALEKEGIILYDRRRILIRNYDAL